MSEFEDTPEEDLASLDEVKQHLELAESLLDGLGEKGVEEYIDSYWRLSGDVHKISERIDKIIEELED